MAKRFRKYINQKWRITMANPIIYRKRLIPEECILLKDDTVLHRSPEIIVTKWNSLKPRKDLHHGCSCYYLQEGIKVSRFYKEDDTLLFWYCDIVTAIMKTRIHILSPTCLQTLSSIPTVS